MKALLFGSTIALLLLSGCNKPKEAGNASGADLSSKAIAEKVNSVKLRPGEWEATQEIVDVKMTGMPAGGSDDMAKRMVGQRSTIKHCVTPEQAANPGAEFLGAQKDAKCDQSKIDMSGGKVSAEIHCGIPQQAGAKMKMTMNGTYLSDHYDLNTQVDTSGTANGVGMTIKMKISGKRVGECPAQGAAK